MVTKISIFGMTCKNCEESIHEKIESLNGVNKVKISLENQNAIIYSSKKIDIENIQQAIGSKYTVGNKDKKDPLNLSYERTLK